MVLNTLNEIQKLIHSYPIALIVFTSKACPVCKPFKMKLQGSLEDFNSSIGFGEVLLDELSESKGVYQIYTVPIALLFIDGREAQRYSAAMDSMELRKTVQRYLNFL